MDIICDLFAAQAAGETRTMHDVLRALGVDWRESRRNSPEDRYMLFTQCKNIPATLPAYMNVK